MTVLDEMLELVFALVSDEVTVDEDIGLGIDILDFNELFTIMVDDGTVVDTLELAPLFRIEPCNRFPEN